MNGKEMSEEADDKNTLSRRGFLKSSLILGGSLLLTPSRLFSDITGRTEHWTPAYTKLDSSGGLSLKIDEAYSILEECRCCPRECGVNRLKGEKGFCRAPLGPMVYSAHPHLGEEIPLVGRRGSGTIFFSNCNLRCIFCQNWPIAHEGRGEEISNQDLADLMIWLQKVGCHNINLVTPTHVMPNILSALRIALHKGLHLPIVYNTSGYERYEIVKFLDGIVDIYLPDFKYTDSKKAAAYSSGASNYPEIAEKAIEEMHRQVGTLKVDKDNIAYRGLMIRHLVMPNRVAGTKKFVKWVSKTLPKSTYVNIMAQYRVEYKAFEHPEIARGITVSEFLEAVDWARDFGLTNLDYHTDATWEYYKSRESN